MEINVDIHIANGDCLGQRLSHVLPNRVFTMRECLVSGPCDAETLSALFSQRRAYVDGLVGSDSDYDRLVVSEIEHLLGIEHLLRDGVRKIWLWFEDDLFCLVNLWFLTDLLSSTFPHTQLMWVRPDTGPIGVRCNSFADIDDEDLLVLLRTGRVLGHAETNLFSGAWHWYRNSDSCHELPLFDIPDEWIISFQRAISVRRNSIDDHLSPRGFLRQKVKSGIVTLDDLCIAFSKGLPWLGYGDLQIAHLLREIL